MKRVMEWSGSGWSVHADGSRLHLETTAGAHSFDARDAASIKLRRKYFGFGPAWLLQGGTGFRSRLRRLKRRDGREMQHRLDALGLFAIIEWGEGFDSVIARGLKAQLWVTQEQRAELQDSRPVNTRVLRIHLRTFPEEAARAVELLALDVGEVVAAANEEIVVLERESKRNFLRTIEKQPLTDEQIRAVLEYDNRVQVVAAAGSGKTSVMVARAAYAIDKGITSPDRVLLLAFNRTAAKELQDRVRDRFKAAGIPSDGIRTSTFHSLGLTAIGAATGSKPKVAPWVGDGSEMERILEIADVLRDDSPDYRYKWDLFRLIYARTPIEGPTAGTPDGYDRDLRATGYETLDGKVVKSFGEKMIADWLFLNGVKYLYEARYPHHTATDLHGQYHPDFYYPDVDAWHEHWAIGADGRPPVEFEGYVEGMKWKRDVHLRYGTDLIETTWHEIVNEVSFDRLESELASRGLELDWNPDRITEPSREMSHSDMARLLRTFMTHVKSNSLTRADLEARLSSSQSRLSGARTRLFLDLYWPIHEAWNAALGVNNYVDFEDMLVKAADHLERGDIDLGYNLVLVDEFQDASRARVRLVMGLLNKPHRHLLAVGDDWQSINRFAGADISAMTEFEHWFGPASQLEMTRTFRFPQNLADISSEFVMKNPRQITKKVVTAGQTSKSTAKAIEVVYSEPSAEVVSKQLKKIARRTTKSDVRCSVFILGRYRFDRDLLPSEIPDNLDVTFLTVHGSKGLEADYVMLPNMAVGTHGFPSGVEDDPILDLAMTEPDTFPHAEERRLFYVALTRARRQVILITDENRPSPFVVEIVGDVEALAAGGSIHPCRICGQGTMVRRESEYGEFYVCSRFPACTAKAKTPDGKPTTKATSLAAKNLRRCTKCGKGTMIIRIGEYGEFYGCSRYPDCEAKATPPSAPNPSTDPRGRLTSRSCPRPRCGGTLRPMSGKNGRFLGCSNYSRGCSYTRNL